MYENLYSMTGNFEEVPYQEYWFTTSDTTGGYMTLKKPLDISGVSKGDTQCYINIGYIVRTEIPGADFNGTYRFGLTKDYNNPSTDAFYFDYQDPEDEWAETFPFVSPTAHPYTDLYVANNDIPEKQADFSLRLKTITLDDFIDIVNQGYKYAFIRAMSNSNDSDWTSADFLKGIDIGGIVDPTKSSKIKVYKNAQWNVVQKAKVFSGGQWKEVKKVKVYKNGAWQEV